MTVYWLNVDLPTKKGRLRRSLCTWVQKKCATKLKGIGEQCEDGGWLELGSVTAAEDYFQANNGKKVGYELVLRKVCF